ncbi:universal stress protein [Weissella koreensis]|uniref:Universal stress protein n=1 Tax=Weissella koreensis TaxID=165096 RepID=A0A7H1MKR6_9LACO|nr:universal stress protein [Weissella koreensis]AEJ23205.1 universal stress protein family [Weissella koreensis KACC 15510]AVH74849.1 universal stress protein [Weissella koreensis]EJF33807.1 universal stress protein UspA [Weissella koreensis KCTC 3621]MCZ9310710.1 universal stress protein [Weissella koreensis]QGN20073.1 universal stress protein [Weissella koreensis]
MALEMNYTNILVPVDGSKEAEAALDQAIEIAKRNHADLHILHVIDTRAFQNVADFKTAMVEEIADTAKKTMDVYLKQAQDAGVEQVEYTIEYGSPKNIIGHQAVEKYGIDLVIMGATGLNTIERFLIGSVTEYVTRSAKVDTLIVRAN